MPNHNFKDLTGQTFGNWKVLSRTENNKRNQARWNCECMQCGNTGAIEGGRLRSGKSKGCKHCGNRKHGAVLHGEKTRLYNIWLNMRARCNNPKNLKYKYYGGKGVSICDAWDNFENFQNWALENGYEDSLTIDRIDGNKGYCPENCRWVPKYKQFANQEGRKGKLIGVKYRPYKTHDEVKNRHYVATIQNGRKTSIFVGAYHTPIEAAFARDFYLMDNDLLGKHNGNFITKETLKYKEI